MHTCIHTSATFHKDILRSNFLRSLTIRFFYRISWYSILKHISRSDTSCHFISLTPHLYTNLKLSNGFCSHLFLTSEWNHSDMGDGDMSIVILLEKRVGFILSIYLTGSFWCSWGAWSYEHMLTILTLDVSPFPRLPCLISVEKGLFVQAITQTICNAKLPHLVGMSHCILILFLSKSGILEWS